MANPQRKCIACNTMYDKASLFRIVKNKGEVYVDTTGKSNGRGCYLCKNSECIKKATRMRLIEKSFKMKISGDIYNTLEEILNA